MLDVVVVVVLFLMEDTLISHTPYQEYLQVL